jgi:undecaprenyl diphosphate synthase
MSTNYQLPTTNYLHLALILDGNRRWARQRKLPRLLGHRSGVQNLRRLLPAFIRNGITHLTTYALSTENLRERNHSELRNLFQLIEKFAQDDTIFFENEIQVNIFGELKDFPATTKKALHKLIKSTKKHRKLIFNLALGYGSRSEIIRAANEFVKINKRATEKTFEKKLYSSDQPSPDLLIRTGGQQRISNFLLWQLSYTELYFTDKMWPEFNEDELEKALRWHAEQQRNFGE